MSFTTMLQSVCGVITGISCRSYTTSSSRKLCLDFNPIIIGLAKNVPAILDNSSACDDVKLSIFTRIFSIGF